MDPATITLTDLDWPGWIQIYILIGMVCSFYERVLYVKVDYAKFGKGVLEHFNNIISNHLHLAFCHILPNKNMG